MPNSNPYNGSSQERNLDDVIIDYLDNTLSPKERADFERQINQNPQLANTVYLQRKIKYAYETPHLKDDIELIESIQKKVEAEKINNPPVILIGIFIFAIVVLVLVTILIFT